MILFDTLALNYTTIISKNETIRIILMERKSFIINSLGPIKPKKVNI